MMTWYKNPIWWLGAALAITFGGEGSNFFYGLGCGLMWAVIGYTWPFGRNGEAA